MKRLLLSLALMFVAAPVQASPLIADISNYRVEIDAGFNGTRLFLFGARNDNGDVVLVVRGPEKNFTVWKKEKIAGIWVNTDHMVFKNVPDYYIIATSRPLDVETNALLYKQLKIGKDTLLTPPRNPDMLPKFNDFSKAFFDFQEKRRLYLPKPEEISFMGETLFKTKADFPDTIPKGEYTAEIYLISDGEVTGVQNMPIQVVKSGMDAVIYDYAHHDPLMYGITAVVVALCAGWGVARIFEKL